MSQTVEVIIISAKLCKKYIPNLCWIAKKNSGSFDKAAQLKAFNTAKETALNQFNSDISRFIVDNYGGLNEWLSTQIEASINKLKN